MRRIALFALLWLIQVAASAAPLPADTAAKTCTRCAEWMEPVEPFLLAPNTWFVGSRGLSAVLIDSGQGLVLLDGGLPQSAPAIATSIRRLGFRIEQLRYILNSHAHFDHAGGIAALARWSGAEVLATESGAAALRGGGVGPDDPQFGYGDGGSYPPVPGARGLADRAQIVLGALNIRIHHTPGHAPGGASYSWPACDASANCVTVVYADSLTAVAAPGYRFIDHPAVGRALQASIARVAELDCDVVVSAHPEFSGLFERRDRRALVEADGCQRYAERFARRLAEQLQAEGQR